MILYTILDWLLNCQTPTVAACSEGMCPASSFHAIAAAFATQGYWAQADMNHFITFTGFQNFAALCYIVAVIGGICGMALGAPPKLYLWFFMGPAVFHWLVGTTQEVKGVAWRVADIQQDQNEVWKLSEAGLAGMNARRRIAADVSANAEPTKPVAVSTLFLWVDELVSDTVQQMISWFGVYRMEGGITGDNSNLIAPPSISGDSTDSRWYLLSNLKWDKLENITAAKLGNPDLRDAFVTFLSNECGQIFNEQIDTGRFTAAAKSVGGLPYGVFKTVASPTTAAGYRTDAYKLLYDKLRKQSIPMPESLSRSLRVATPAGGGASNPDIGSFAASLGNGSNGTYHYPGVLPNEYSSATKKLWVIATESVIQCDTYLDLLVMGFRWETGHIYNQFVSNLPKGTSPADIVYALFYGWHMKMYSDPFVQSGTPNPPNLTQTEQHHFLKDLILVHLFRNELLIAPKAVDLRYSSSNELVKYVEDSQRTQGQKSKYGEVYTWAKMMPHLQGVMLYLLALGYPFACMFVMIPGWHKIVATWASFWIWVKLWDVGFAIVMVLERSIWSILGNNSRAETLYPYVAEMQSW